VRVSLDRPILNPEQAVLMNPLVLTLTGAFNLPNTPASYAELDARCKPTYASFQFFGQQRQQARGGKGSLSTTRFRRVGVVSVAVEHAGLW
jgi:hypothetical protein